MKFQLIDKAKNEFPVHRLCGVLGVVSAMTWCCWHTFDPRSHCRTALMAVRG